MRDPPSSNTIGMDKLNNLELDLGQDNVAFAGLNDEVKDEGCKQLESGVEDKDGREMKEEKCDDFDDIVDRIGSHGKYQRFLLYAVLCPIISLQPLFTLNNIFMLFVPDHWCNVDQFDGFDRNATDPEFWKNLTIPKEVGPDGKLRYSQCEQWSRNQTKIGCTSGWDFDRVDFETTLPSEFNWVCNKAHYATDVLTIFSLGNAVGTIIFGRCADKFGRKPIFFISNLIILIFRVISLYIPSQFTIFLILQFLSGTSFPIMYIAPSMIIAEISDNEYRAWIYSLTWVIWVMGMAGLPLIAWLTANWYSLGLWTSLPGIFLFVYWYWLPESPRWLCQVGRISEAKAGILKIAKFNGNEDKLSPTQLDRMLKKLSIKNEEMNKKKLGIWTLFSSLRLAKNTCLICISWSMNALIYFGITINANQMSGNQFVNFFILAMIEVPAGFLGGFLAERYGRRWTQVVFFKLCFLTCLIAGIAAIHSSLFYLTTTCIIIAKFSITLTFLVVYLQGTELFPTLLRSTGSGLASTVASIIASLGPYIVFLGKLDLSAPYYALAGLSLIGVIASAFLPETLGQKLPETIEEASEFGRFDKFWSLWPASKKEEGKDLKN